MLAALAPTDWTVIAVYFFAVFALAFWVTKREKSTTQTSSGYFLAGRNVGWFVIGASLFASNIGSEHLIGLAGTGAKSGVAVGQFEILASLILLLLGWVFVPFYIKSGVFTMPEFLERRYSVASRRYLALISVVGYVLTKISVTVYAGGVMIQAVLGPEYFWPGAIAVVLATGIYTILGGLRAVLYTDLLQMFVLVGGSIAVTCIGLGDLGGWEAMRDTAGAGFMSMWKPISDPDFPWTGILFGAPILGVWYWCTDQYIVQRVLSAKNIAHARGGTLFGGFLKILPLFIFVIPGVVAYGLAQKGALNMPADQTDQALPLMIDQLLGPGLRGLVVAALLAALMSSLSSVFNSCSTVIAWDFYRELRPHASEKQLVTVGQIATVVMVVFGLLWIPFMKNISGQLYTYLQSVQAYISPPIASVFLLGLMWRRLNAHGAIAALLSGFVLGGLRLGLEIMKDKLDGQLLYFAEIRFLHFAIILFFICSLVHVIVSLLTRPQSDEKLAGLTFATAKVTSGEEAQALSDTKSGRALEIAFSLLLIAAVGAVWIYFSPLMQAK